MEAGVGIVMRRPYSGKLLFVMSMLSVMTSVMMPVASQDTDTPAEFTVRLVNGSRKSEGRLEVFVGGKWGTVCDDNFDAEDAQVICRMLNYVGGTSHKKAKYGEGSGAILLDEVTCTGREISLRNCLFRYDSNCGHNEDVGIECEVPLTTESTPVTTVGFASTAERTTEEVVSTVAEGAVLDVLEVLERIEDALNRTDFITNQTVVDAVVNDLSEVMTEADPETLTQANTGHRLLKAIERVSREMALPDSQVTSTSPKLAISALKVDSDAFSGLTLVADAGNDNIFQDGEVRTYNTTRDSKESASSLVLPASLLTSLGNATRIALVVLADGTIFEAITKSRDASKSHTTRDDDSPYIRKVKSPILSASVVGYDEVLNLKDPVVMRFVHLDKNDFNRRPECVFWNASLAEGQGDWSTAGCRLVAEKSTKLRTTCECNHLTNFALLMDVYERGDELSREHSQILSFISYTGCGMSLLALILTILTYCCCNPLVAGKGSTGNESSFSSGGYRRRICRLNKPSKILISLCIALALSNLVFVAGMQNYALNNTTACKVVAMLLHFCLLSSMCWMSVEAFYVYLALVRVFRTRITHFILKASCFGWGAPLLIVSVTAGVHTLDNYAPLNSGMCWLRGVAFYSAFVAPVSLTLVFNFISFAFVLRTIVGLKHNKAGKAESSQSVQKLRRAVCVVVLLGLTWVFGFLAVDGATQIVFYYLFAVFNSLQGLFIFLFYCVFNQDARAACGRCFRCCWERFSREVTDSTPLHSLGRGRNRNLLLKSSTGDTSLGADTGASVSSSSQQAFSVL